ncbi:MAG: glutathione synthase [Glaciecola sp.]|jgi:glutathione synthase
MKRYKIIVLTDHANHSTENSLYPLASEMAAHPQCQYLDISSRGNVLNDDFFHQQMTTELMVKRVTESIHFDRSGDLFVDNQQIVDFRDYDLVMLRIPRPVTDEFLKFIKGHGPEKVFVNEPLGMTNTSSKAFMLNFPECCPPIKLCKSVHDVLAFSENKSIVLKPLREYGGRGILKISGDTIDDGKEIHDKALYLRGIKQTLEGEGYLGMTFLKNVDQGDKRIIVIGGEILASSLRLPPHNSWICNVALGGKSVKSEATDHEKSLIAIIAPIMKEQGILIYGVDTLVNDDGKRVISEVNTMSIGGFPQAEKQTGMPLIKKTIQKIIDYTNDRFNK